MTWLGVGPADGVTRLNSGRAFGREPGPCDVVLESNLISRRHARVEVGAEERIELVDLGASNGTFINGRRVAGATLSDGDRAGFGTAEEVHCLFRAAPSARCGVEGPAPGDAEAVKAILGGELKRCRERSRVVTSASGACRYCSAGGGRPSGNLTWRGRPACGWCGTAPSEGSSFCHRCGSRLT